MKRSLKKLTLNRETIRALQDAELRSVAGGFADEVRLGGGLPISRPTCRVEWQHNRQTIMYPVCPLPPRLPPATLICR